jgi:RND family efflux transporter MFP subunit
MTLFGDFVNKHITYGLLLAVVVGCSRPSQERSVDLTVPVTVASATVGLIEATFIVTGTLRAIREAELLAEVKGDLFLAKANGSGLLTQGSEVRKGQVVARLANKEWMVNANLESRRLAKATADHTVREKQALFSRGLATEVDLQNARKALADAVSGYEDAVIKVSKTEIRASLTGVLTDVTTVTDGTEIKAGNSIAKIVDYTEVLVDLRVPNSQILNVIVGRPVRVTNHALPDRQFIGSVTSVDPVLDPVTRTLKVVATVDNADLMLRPGMFVKAEIVTDSRENAIIVPKELVVRRQNQEVVFVESNARAEMRQVTTGLESRDSIEVTVGLEEGDRLITSNYETLRSRTRVRVTDTRTP